MVKSIVLIIFAVITLVVSACNIVETTVDETINTSSDVLTNTPPSFATSSEEFRILDVSLSYMSLLSPVNGLSTTVGIVNSHKSIVAGKVTCEEGTLNDSGKKENIYFSKDNTASVTYTVPKFKVNDSLIFTFYDENSKAILTKTLLVVADDKGFALFEEQG